MTSRDNSGSTICCAGASPSLSAAILRINTSLDPDTVLREAVKSARLLTNARYSVITTIDEAAQPQDFVTSGFTTAAWRTGAPDRGCSTPARRSGAAEDPGPWRVRALAWSFPAPPAGDILPGNPHAPSGRACWQLLPRPEGNCRFSSPMRRRSVPNGGITRSEARGRATGNATSVVISF